MGLLLTNVMPAYAGEQLDTNLVAKDQPIMLEADNYYNQTALKYNDFKIEGQSMSEQEYAQEVKQMMQEYSVKTNQELSVTNENISPEMVESFVEMQVQNGVIEDTAIARATMSKETYRALFSESASLASALFPTAAYFLQHSLQDYPSDLVYTDGMYTTNLVYSSPEMTNLKNRVHSDVIGTGGFGRNYSVEFSSSNSWDLYLAIHGASCFVNANRYNSGWKINYKLSDVYNFEKWPEGKAPAAVTAVNNLALDAQAVGAIVPYNVYISHEEIY